MRIHRQPPREQIYRPKPEAKAPGHHDAIRAAAVRAMAALSDKRPAGIVAAIEAGDIPHVSIDFGEQ